MIFLQSTPVCQVNITFQDNSDILSTPFILANSDLEINVTNIIVRRSQLNPSREYDITCNSKNAGGFLTSNTTLCKYSYVG